MSDKSGYFYIGNSIGNIHGLDSGENRSYGDASVNFKLTIDNFAKNALIQDVSKELWRIASGKEPELRCWEETRALAFQSAVEQRTFALYTKFYEDLCLRNTGM